MAKKLNPDERARMLRLFTENGLSPSDVFAHNHFTIITRTGIEKIQAMKKISVSYQIEKLEPDFVVVKAFGEMETPDGDVRVETYGESSPKNNKTSYPVAMAEKRALSRAVLKLAGLYSEPGLIGEDEKPDE
tara:strand:- start:502 stop:897 length:396 start_codon:yes stop_codon:yes gene_type:complete